MASKKYPKDTAKLIHMMTTFFWETFVAMALGYFLGKWLDSIFFIDQTILLYVGVVLGVFAGLRNLIIRALAYAKGEANETQNKRD